MVVFNRVGEGRPCFMMTCEQKLEEMREQAREGHSWQRDQQVQRPAVGSGLACSREVHEGQCGLSDVQKCSGGLTMYSLTALLGASGLTLGGGTEHAWSRGGGISLRFTWGWSGCTEEDWLGLESGEGGGRKAEAGKWIRDCCEDPGPEVALH